MKSLSLRRASQREWDSRIGSKRFRTVSSRSLQPRSLHRLQLKEVTPSSSSSPWSHLPPHSLRHLRRPNRSARSHNCRTLHPRSPPTPRSPARITPSSSGCPPPGRRWPRNPSPWPLLSRPGLRFRPHHRRPHRHHRHNPSRLNPRPHHLHRLHRLSPRLPSRPTLRPRISHLPLQHHLRPPFRAPGEQLNHRPWSPIRTASRLSSASPCPHRPSNEISAGAGTGLPHSRAPNPTQFPWGTTWHGWIRPPTPRYPALPAHLLHPRLLHGEAEVEFHSAHREGTAHRVLPSWRGPHCLKVAERPPSGGSGHGISSSSGVFSDW